MRPESLGVLVGERHAWLRAAMDSTATRVVQVAGTRAFIQATTFVVMMVLAREFGPSSFGVYALAAVLGVAFGELVGIGADVTAVRFSAPHWQDNAERAWFLFRVVGSAKIALGVGVVLVGVGGADFVGTRVLGHPELSMAVRAGCIAALAVSLTEFGLSILQARERFATFASVGAGVALIRSMPLLVLAAAGWLTLPLALAVYVCSSYLGCALTLAPHRRALVSARGRYGSTLRELLGYAGWLSLTAALGTVSNSLDSLVVSYFEGPRSLGIYAAARSLAVGIAVLTIANVSVLLPRFGRMKERAVRQEATARAAWWTSILGLSVAAGMTVAASPLVRLIYGAHYLEAIPVLQILALGYSLEVATTALVVFLLVENRPDVLAKSAALGLLAASAGYAWVVPALGNLGAALVFLGGRVVVTLACVAWVAFRLRHSIEELVPAR